MTREEVIKIVNEARAAGTRPDLRGAGLRRANLAGENLEGVDLEGVDLAGATLEGANLIDANLYRANLQGANLYGSNLRGANLEGANLRAANLNGANLTGANLTGAALTAAELIGADLTGVQIDYDIPKVANLIGKILDADRLDMSDWHSECGTAHCLAGWATTLAGEAGAKLEKEIGIRAAGALIWRASVGEIPDFYAENEDAKASLRERA